MSTLKELLKQHGHSAAAEIEWLHMVVAEWQLIADLSMADLVLWVKSQDGQYIAVASARPASALPILYRDITGEVVPDQWRAGIEHAADTGLIFFSPKTTFDSINSRLEVVPVRRVTSTTDQSQVAEPIAFLSRHTQIDYVQTPNKISINYVKAANDLLEMVAHGMFPDFGTPTASRRGAPRANDGVLRLDEYGKVLFASPNATSALSRFGAEGELEGHMLSALVTKTLKTGAVDESLPLVLSGRAAW
ncbi:MAG: histidine kinase N-terminal domain-containing protein, partial [Micrococcales bacterium]